MQVTAEVTKNQQQQHQLYHQPSVAVRLNVGNLPESQVRGHQQPARAEENLDEEVRRQKKERRRKKHTKVRRGKIVKLFMIVDSK